MSTPGTDVQPIAPRTSVFDAEFRDLPHVSIHLPDPSFLRGINGVTFAATPIEADLTYNVATGHMLSAAGDRAGYIGNLQGPSGNVDLQNIADKMRSARALGHLSSALDIHFASGDKNYGAGEVVTIQINGRQTDQVTLMNISADGTVNYVYPVDLPSQNISDPDRTSPIDKLNLPVQVTPSFGSDYVFAFETWVDPSRLRSLLASYNSSSDIPVLWSELRQSARASGQDVNVAAFAFQTVQN